ncbi:predicted protein [Streptomyces sp. C]|nr:predicted protein [Streptomyces sp. C]
MLAWFAASRGRASTGPVPVHSCAWSGRVWMSGWNLAVPTETLFVGLTASKVPYGWVFSAPGAPMGPVYGGVHLTGRNW